MSIRTSTSITIAKRRRFALWLLARSESEELKRVVREELEMLDRALGGEFDS